MTGRPIEPRDQQFLLDGGVNAVKTGRELTRPQDAERLRDGRLDHGEPQGRVDVRTDDTHVK